MRFGRSCAWGLVLAAVDLDRGEVVRTHCQSFNDAALAGDRLAIHREYCLRSGRIEVRDVQ